VNISDIAAWCGISFSNASSTPLYHAHHLFLNGEEMKDLTIPNSVTSIGPEAFNHCSRLTSVTIGNSVKAISDCAFAWCSSLTSIISKIENPCNIPNDCFSQDVYFNSTQYVPQDTTENYKETAYWNKFLFIEKSAPSGIGVAIVKIGDKVVKVLMK